MIPVEPSSSEASCDAIAHFQQSRLHGLPLPPLQPQSRLPVWEGPWHWFTADPMRKPGYRGSPCPPSALSCPLWFLFSPFLQRGGMITVWSYFCRRILRETPSSARSAPCRWQSASPARVPFALNILVRLRGQRFSPSPPSFYPKHRPQLSLSFREMNVASLAGTVLAVQCNLNNANSSCLFRVWQTPGSVLHSFCVLPHLIP